MDAPTLNAAPRETGKKATRAVRDSNNVPCILYGRDTDPVPFQVSVHELNRLIYSRQTSVVDVSMDDDSWSCVLKDYTLHPISDVPEHADFQVLREGRRVTLTVPVRYEGIPEGQKEGGDTQILVREITISCLPKNIPSEIKVDISGLDIGEAIHLYDLDQEAYRYKMAQGQTLVTVVAPHLEAVATTEEEEELEDEELPEGEEAEGAAEEEGEEAEEAPAA